MSLYSDNVKRVFLNARAPYKGLITDILEYEGHLTLVVYRENLKQYTGEQQQQLGVFIIGLLEQLKTMVPINVEVKERVPRQPGL